MKAELRRLLQQGLVIPACPLALNAHRRLDERRQRALVRYYVAAGAGAIAAGVHTTQFAIRDARVGLFKPVLNLIGEELDRTGPRAAPSRSSGSRGLRPYQPSGERSGDYCPTRVSGWTPQFGRPAGRRRG